MNPPIEALPVREALRLGTADLQEVGLSDPSWDTARLLARALEMELWRLYVEPERPLGGAELSRFQGLVRRRADHEPMAYILGAREFYGRPFGVSPVVLIPRPETEHLVEAALRRTPSDAPLIAEVGTGSGCVAVTLALEIPGARVVATDSSPEALEVAGENAERHGVEKRVELRQGRDLEPLQDLQGRVDLLVSNPPYVSESEFEGLERQVREWEPREALVAGPTGLEALGRMAGPAAELLGEGGWFLLEVGHDQAASAREILAAFDVEVERDLAGIERVIQAQKRGSPE